MYGHVEFEKGLKALKQCRSSVQKLIVRRNGVQVSHRILSPGKNSKRREKELKDLLIAAGELRCLALSVFNDPFDNEFDDEQWLRRRLRGEE
jgi:hypothetical protein